MQSESELKRISFLFCFLLLDFDIVLSGATVRLSARLTLSGAVCSLIKVSHTSSIKLCVRHFCYAALLTIKSVAHK